jgi:threonine dehydrogenase-like Zn-dependent dehydrogenase
MRAVAMLSAGHLTVVSDWPEPRCGPDEVVVAVRGVGLCGSDLAVASGTWPVPALPWVLGHEAFGTIAAVGGDVGDRATGQRVVIEPNFPCLSCDQCRAGATAGCRRRRIPGINEPGLLAERIAVPARFTWPVPAAWPDDDLACVEPLAVARNAVDHGGSRPGQRCLVVGAGSQGLLVCLALLHAGGVPFVTDPQPDRVLLARQLGAHDASQAPGELFPVVIETSGTPEAFESALDAAEPGGCLVLVGMSKRPARVSTFTLVRRRLTIHGCLIYDHPAGFAATIAALRHGGLEPARVVRGRFGLAEAPRAFAEAASIAGKTWISMAEPEEIAS